jgi:hypothetical protein
MGLRYVRDPPRLDTVARDPPACWAPDLGAAAGDVLLPRQRAALAPVLPALLEQLAARGLKCVSLPAACSLS